MEFSGFKIVRNYTIPGIVGEVTILEGVKGKFKGKGIYMGSCGHIPNYVYGNAVEEVEEKILSEAKNYLRRYEDNLKSQSQIVNNGLEFVTQKLSENIPQLNVGGKK
jgi:hypothetical protein